MISLNFFQDFLNWTGASNTSGTTYGFWSGFGSDLAEFAILGSLIGVYRHHNCTVKRCPRIGKHPVDGTPYKTCHRHATQVHHDRLHAEHKNNYPSQHKLLNKGEKK